MKINENNTMSEKVAFLNSQSEFYYCEDSFVRHEDVHLNEKGVFELRGKEFHGDLYDGFQEACEALKRKKIEELEKLNLDELEQVLEMVKKMKEAAKMHKKKQRIEKFHHDAP